MQKVFGGKLQTTYECLNCKSVSLHKECFTDLHLAVPEQKNTKSNSETTNTTIGKRKNIVLKQRLMPCKKRTNSVLLLDLVLPQMDYFALFLPTS